ncbi:MAG: Leucine-rich repeat (LRR) protein [Arcticibacterium sp.]|jgi:Leucine-rich repeat (LRR) protein
MQRVITLILICFNSSAFSQECYIADWQVLKDLYTSTNGDNWTGTMGWTYIKNATGPTVDCPPVNLKGINLIETDYFEIEGREDVSIMSVHDIDLALNNLTGYLESSIGDFSVLHQLTLEANAINGSLPKEIEKLEFLVGLSLGFNNFSGPVPVEIYKLNVVSLNLSHNQFTGNPLGYLPNPDNLKNVYLSHNLFEGNVIEFLTRMLFTNR